MTNWEYQVIEAPQAGVPAAQMNDNFGKEGWQLSGIIPKDKDGTGYYFYFCRPATDAVKEADSPPGFGAVDKEEDAE